MIADFGRKRIHPGHLGVLKSVQGIRDREFGDWLAVVAVHEGREHHGAFRCDGPPSLSELELEF